MKTQLDIRSMFIGILLAICCFLVLGAAKSYSPTLGNARFLLAAPAQGSNMYIIDTTSGQVWEKMPGSYDDAVNFRKPKIENVSAAENN